MHMWLPASRDHDVEKLCGYTGRSVPGLPRNHTWRPYHRVWSVINRRYDACIRSSVRGPFNEGPGVSLWINDPDEANTPGLVQRWPCIDVHLRQAAVARVWVVNPYSGPANAPRIGTRSDLAALEQKHRRSSVQFGVDHDTVAAGSSASLHEPEAADQPVTHGGDVLVDEVERKTLRVFRRSHRTRMLIIPTELKRPPSKPTQPGAETSGCAVVEWQDLRNRVLQNAGKEAVLELIEWFVLCQ